VKIKEHSDLSVLVIDDDDLVLNFIGDTFRKAGISNVLLCQNGKNAISQLSKYSIGACTLDLSMPDITGQALLEQIVKNHPEIPVIVVSGHNEVDTAIECIKMGAFDYIVKPADSNRLVTTIKRALAFREIKVENESLKQRLLTSHLKHPEIFSSIISNNSGMHSIFQYIESIAATGLPLLITGETGSGKELIAKAIHEVSGRTGKIVTINIAGVDDHFFSDTLFGHIKGAFTGAEKERKGLIEKAKGGTLFLDEIGDLGPESQVKLLRLLQEGAFYPMGSDTPCYSAARIVTATNKNLEAMQKANQFRPDLFYRLESHRIHIPPLRERLDDLPLLIEHFLQEAANEMNKKKPTYPPDLITLLSTYLFPGNVRELRGMVFDAVSRHESKILSMDIFKQKIQNQQKTETLSNSSSKTSDTDPISQLISLHRLPRLKETEEALISEALKRSNGNQGVAADLIGLTRAALNKRLSRKTYQPQKG